jgi:hypothetical protein
MRRNLMVLSLLILVQARFLPASADVVEVSEHLELLRPLMNREWVGHYTDEETAHFIHQVAWDAVCGGGAVRMTKLVDELDFAAETLYYWNAVSAEVAYVTVTNRGQVSVGTAAAAGDTIELLGHDLTEEGEVAYRYTFCISDDGILEDRFYRWGGVRWEERHLIRYEQDKGAGSEAPAD